MLVINYDDLSVYGGSRVWFQSLDNRANGFWCHTRVAVLTEIVIVAGR